MDYKKFTDRKKLTGSVSPTTKSYVIRRLKSHKRPVVNENVTVPDNIETRGITNG